MSEVEDNSILYAMEQMAYNDFLKKGVKGLDDNDLIAVHALLARCEFIFDRERKFIRLIEHELLMRLS